MHGLLQTSFFFGYNAVVCFAFFLMLGSVGWRASLLFVRSIYKVRLGCHVGDRVRGGDGSCRDSTTAAQTACLPLCPCAKSSMAAGLVSCLLDAAGVLDSAPASRLTCHLSCLCCCHAAGHQV